MSNSSNDLIGETLPTLPTWEECEKAVDAGIATALQQFIYYNEPADIGADFQGAAEFREQLASAIALAQIPSEEWARRWVDVLRGFVPCTYGDAIGAGWIRHGDCEPHEWDNRTSAENARWMLDHLPRPSRDANGSPAL